MVNEMFARSHGKSLRQAVRESGLTRYSINTILSGDLNWRTWKPHYCQALSAEDCDRRLEYGEVMQSWHKDQPELYKNKSN